MDANLISTFKYVLSELEAEKIDYMIVGSVASIMYGEPRVTRDLDLVVELQMQDVEKIYRRFAPPRFYLPPKEILTQEVVSRGYFNLLDIPSGLKVDFIVRKLSAHAITEFNRRQRLEFIPNFSTWVASAEDIILKKLAYFKEGKSQKHITDIEGILANTPVDQAYLDYWIPVLGLQDSYKLVTDKQ